MNKYLAINLINVAKYFINIRSNLSNVKNETSNWGIKYIVSSLLMKETKINSHMTGEIKNKTNLVLYFKTSTVQSLQKPVKKNAVMKQGTKKNCKLFIISKQKDNESNENSENLKLQHSKDNSYNDTSYYFENNLRKVYPYYFTFTRFTKGSWVGMKALEVFKREFRSHPSDNYETYFKSGILSVNNQRVDIDYRLKHNDLLAKCVQRHEDPVTDQPITFIHVDNNLVVINKPASIPVYPCGRYRFNTVLFILAKEFDLPNLKTIHRLDKSTSGLLLLGRTPKVANKLSIEFKNGLVKKEYLCIVEGEFPNGEIEFKEPVKLLKYNIPLSKISPGGKECSTLFKRLSYNVVTNTSIVLCQPKTGRQHQLRVHLQYMGYPIVNDPLYNHPAFGPLRGKGGDIGSKSDEQLVKDLCVANYWLGRNATEAISKRNSGVHLNHQDKFFSCIQDFVMYLHAWKYSGPGWVYKTKLPLWTYWTQGCPSWPPRVP